jgi:predicted ribosome-associated RNA-binding protein Tma20
MVDSGQQKWLKTFIDNKGQVMESIVGTAAEVIAHGLLSLKKEQSEGRVLSVKELKEISSIIMDMDKIARLESGKATEIIHNTALTPDEARKILASDPFMRPIEVEVIKKDE